MTWITREQCSEHTRNRQPVLLLLHGHHAAYAVLAEVR
jgi:hypothetical protein